jgi:hypothetical protein
LCLLVIVNKVGFLTVHYAFSVCLAENLNGCRSVMRNSPLYDFRDFFFLNINIFQSEYITAVIQYFTKIKVTATV